MYHQEANVHAFVRVGGVHLLDGPQHATAWGVYTMILHSAQYVNTFGAQYDGCVEGARFSKLPDIPLLENPSLSPLAHLQLNLYAATFYLFMWARKLSSILPSNKRATGWTVMGGNAIY